MADTHTSQTDGHDTHLIGGQTDRNDGADDQQPDNVDADQGAPHLENVNDNHDDQQPHGVHINQDIGRLDNDNQGDRQPDDVHTSQNRGRFDNDDDAQDNEDAILPNGQSDFHDNEDYSMLQARIDALPVEIHDRIFEEAGIIRFRWKDIFKPPPHPASIPPDSGHSPLLSLPVELRRKLIEAELLPNGKGSIVQPSHRRKVMTRIRDLLTLNKQLHREFTTILYEELTFTVHVYGGLATGGVELLDSGRQQLHRQSIFKTDSYPKFTLRGPHGLSRMKRLHITIHPVPASEDDDDQDQRHTCMHTHYMVSALVDILTEHQDPNATSKSSAGLTSLKITVLDNPIPPVAEQFTEPDADDQTTAPAPAPEGEPWWDNTSNKPRETSIHGLSNLQIVLWPFLRIRGAWNVLITVSILLGTYGDTGDWLDDLINRMKGLDRITEEKDGSVFKEQEMMHKFEVARLGFEEWVFARKFGWGRLYGADEERKFLDWDMDEDEGVDLRAEFMEALLEVEEEPDFE